MKLSEILGMDEPVTREGSVTTYRDLVQGTDEWLAARLGLITASEMKLVLTPTLKPANNEKTRQHVYELAAQRISRFVEPRFVGDDMLRGTDDEIEARRIYNEHIAPIQTVGFITNDRWGFTLGYSPDALVGNDGLIEIKSRLQKYQVQTIAENVLEGTIPPEYVLQAQTGLLVSERDWLDFVSYSNGLPMAVIRVWPNEAVQDAILEACAAFEAQIAATVGAYGRALKSDARLIPTERKAITEMHL
jgi:hypothetical protein